MNHPSPISAEEAALTAPSDQSLRVPCYCEENVWRLVYRKLHSQTRDSSLEYFVIFITNPLKCVPMFHQLAASSASKPCYWDYHVILISCSKEDNSSAQVFDMDSRLPFPCDLKQYLTNVFPARIPWPVEYSPYFRMVQAELFLEIFSSDRMHMYNPVTDEWSEQPPPYACILPSKSNLMEYMTIDQEDLESRLTTDRDSKNPFGNVLSLPELARFFGIDPSNRHIDEVT